MEQKAATLIALTCVWVSGTVPVRAQLSLENSNNRVTEIKALYEAADYDRVLALAALIDSAATAPMDLHQIHLYQALCQLAVGNQSAAESTLEGILRAEPLYQPSADMPNRLRILLDAVRTRVGPALAYDHFRTGKDLFTAKNHAAAAKEFAVVLALTEQSDVETSAALGDLRTLAGGFLDLSTEALSTTSNPVPAAVETRVEPPAATNQPARASDGPGMAAVAIREDVPRWPAYLGVLPKTGGEGPKGLVELVIDRNGRVATVRWLLPINSYYDAMLVRAAKQWTYRPATMNGEPVESVRRLAVTLQ